MVPPPVIIVQDWADNPPTSLYYINGDNEVELKIVYTTVAKLRSHPGRGTITIAPPPYKHISDRMRLSECDKSFLIEFWHCIAHILNYLADFFIHDTRTMQSVWLHLITTLQSTVDELPHKPWNVAFPYCPHAAGFNAQWQQTVKLMNRVILARPSISTDGVIHHDHGLLNAPIFNNGAFKAGLKPWAQFLLKGSPGFAVKKQDMVSEYEMEDEQKESKEHEMEDEQKEAKEYHERHVPAGALAIIQKHTENMRKMAVKVARRDQNINEDNFLHDFDNNSLRLDAPNSYISLTGNHTTTWPVHVSPGARNAPQRTEKFRENTGSVYNPSIRNLEGSAELWKTDEVVGCFRGDLPVKHPLDRDNQNPRITNKHHMWTVKTSVEDTPSNGSGSSSSTFNNDSANGKDIKDVLGDVFDEWQFDSQEK